MVVAAVVVRVMVIVVIVPYVNSVTTVLVAPLHFGLEVRPLAVLVALDGMVGVSAFVAEVPGVWVGNAGIPGSLMDESRGHCRLVECV